jgi:hypothetical protein
MCRCFVRAVNSFELARITQFSKLKDRIQSQDVCQQLGSVVVAQQHHRVFSTTIFDDVMKTREPKFKEEIEAHRANMDTKKDRVIGTINSKVHCIGDHPSNRFLVDDFAQAKERREKQLRTQQRLQRMKEGKERKKKEANNEDNNNGDDGDGNDKVVNGVCVQQRRSVRRDARLHLRR